MASFDLIDTTEMYLKTIYEMEEDGVLPLRARIVERLGHSGPTVSQTIARMERDNLVHVSQDRRLELTPEGRQIAVEVIRKHRLIERLLVDVIGLGWADAHDEACRWEHVVSETVEERLGGLLDQPLFDPYGNPIPGAGTIDAKEHSLEQLPGGDGDYLGVVSRIGEPIQAESALLAAIEQAGIRPGVEIRARRIETGYAVGVVTDGEIGEDLGLEALFAPHFFMIPA